MKDKWGDTVDIPSSDVQRALNSGYSYASPAPSAPPVPSAPTPSTPSPTTSSTPSTSPQNLDPAGYSLVYYNGQQQIVPNSGSGGWASHNVTLITPNVDRTTGKPVVQASIPPKETAPTISNLTFRAGLTDTQKKSITTMLTNRINTALNETDAKNLAYALGETDWQQYANKTSSQLGLANAPIENPPVGAETPAGFTDATTWDSTNFSDYPEELKNTEIWRNATAYDKLMLYTTFKTKQVQDPQIQARMQEALATAMNSLDPYYKMKTRLAVDEIERTSLGTTQDFASKVKSLEDKKRQIEEDLIYNKDYLTMEQQADMAKQKREYENQLYSTQQQMAEAGLAFSSPRARAEEQLKTENQGTVESITRQYNKAIREQQLGTERQAAELQQNVADLERQKGEALTKTSRTAEEYLGSTNVPTVPGVAPLGGIQGTLEAEKQAKALQYGSAIQNVYKENI